MAEHPIASVRDRLVPESLCYVKVFEAPDLEQQIAQWVDETGNLIVLVGPLSSEGHLALTYVPAVRGNHDPGRAAAPVVHLPLGEPKPEPVVLPGKAEAQDPSPPRAAPPAAPFQRATSASAISDGASRTRSGGIRVPALATKTTANSPGGHKGVGPKTS